MRSVNGPDGQGGGTPRAVRPSIHQLPHLFGSPMMSARRSRRPRQVCPKRRAKDEIRTPGWGPSRVCGHQRSASPNSWTGVVQSVLCGKVQEGHGAARPGQRGEARILQNWVLLSKGQAPMSLS